MRFDPVIIHLQDRQIVCRTMGETLLAYGVQLVELSVGGQHVHALCRFPRELPTSLDGTPRPLPRNLPTDGRDGVPGHILGRAKRAASIELLHLGRKPPDCPLWTKHAKFVPIRDRQHQLNVVGYIRSHAQDNAAVWSHLQRP